MSTAADYTAGAAQDPTPSSDPWTRAEFMRALRAAGWERLPGPAAVYRSPDDPAVRFQLDAYRRHLGGVAWRYFAGRRELPATTRAGF